MKEEIIKILFKHRANDRGNKDLNLFDDKEQLEEQDSYYADMILDLFQKDKIIQIIVDSEGAYTGLSESGKMYDFIPQPYKFEKGKYLKDENGHSIPNPEKPAHWELVIDSPGVSKR